MLIKTAGHVIAPAYPAQINKLVAGSRLIRAFLPHTPVATDAGFFPLISGSGHSTVSGNRLIVSAGGSDYTTYGTLVEAGTVGQPNALTTFTALFIATPTTLAVRSSLFSSGSGAAGIGFGQGYSTNTKVFAYVNTATSSYVAEGGTNVFAANERAVFAWVYDTGAAVTNKFFKNGALVYSANTSGSSASLAAGNGLTKMGGPYQSATTDMRTWQGSIELGVMWSRALSDQEIASISSQPFKLFAPLRIYIPTAAAAATVPTLSASTYVPGSLTSTGWRPQITAS